jgi:hypothetical protein
MNLFLWKEAEGLTFALWIIESTLADMIVEAILHDLITGSKEILNLYRYDQEYSRLILIFSVLESRKDCDFEGGC